MYATFRASTSKFFEKSRLFLDIISGMDDPQGDYMFAVDRRLRALESEVQRLQARVSVLEGGGQGGD
ncbi:hypothetical protein EDF70_110113 [Neorhizobium sp. JUb45]|nr:hypothetical protein EDF70_110113 [Neorhizobium sp. JUb45]